VSAQLLSACRNDSSGTGPADTPRRAKRPATARTGDCTALPRHIPGPQRSAKVHRRPVKVHERHWSSKLSRTAPRCSALIWWCATASHAACTCCLSSVSSSDTFVWRTACPSRRSCAVWAGKAARSKAAVGGIDRRSGQGRWPYTNRHQEPRRQGQSSVGTGQSSVTRGRPVSWRFERLEQWLDRDQKRERGSARNNPACQIRACRRDLSGRARAVPAATAAHGSQPEDRRVRRSASRTREARSRCRRPTAEGMGPPSGLAVRRGQLAHVAVADHCGDARQRRDSDPGRRTDGHVSVPRRRGSGRSGNSGRGGSPAPLPCARPTQADWEQVTGDYKIVVRIMVRPAHLVCRVRSF
jgi:hypothetical protein